MRPKEPCRHDKDEDNADRNWSIVEGLGIDGVGGGQAEDDGYKSDL